MSMLVQILLLAPSAFFCLTPVDAVKCKDDSHVFTFSTANINYCEVDPATETCHTRKTYYEQGDFTQIFRSCERRENAKCDLTEPNLQGGWIKHLCCTNKDFCNENL